MGGNLCNAAPSADMAPALIVLDALARIENPTGARELPLLEFFTGPWRTVLGTGEILVSIHLPKPPPGASSAYLKYAARENDLAIVGAGAAITIKGGICRSARLALGLQSGDRVLDLACGTGLNFGHYPPETVIVGAEPDPHMLRRARKTSMSMLAVAANSMHRIRARTLEPQA